MLGHDEDIQLLTQYKTALEEIASIWPEPPNCADIYSVGGINDGYARAITAGSAIEIARKTLNRPFTPYHDPRGPARDLDKLTCKHCKRIIGEMPKYYCAGSPTGRHEPEAQP